MNRPKWLELIYLIVFFTLPIILAVVATSVVAKFFELSRTAQVGAYIAFVVAMLFLWMFGLIVWARAKSARQTRETGIQK